MESNTEPSSKKQKIAEVDATPAVKVEFKTNLSHVFHRSKDNATIARMVTCTGPDGSVQLVQLGRFKDGWDATKFLVSLNCEEMQWLIKSIPTFVKDAQLVKDCDSKPVLATNIIGKRTFTVSLSRFNFPKGGSAKNLELSQSWIRNDDEVTRNVSLPLKEFKNMPEVLKQ